MNFVKICCAAILSTLAPAFFANAAQAHVQIDVNLSSQTMHVAADNGQTYDWRISSARAGHVTPPGVYPIERLETMHRSKKYHNSPMPHSMFFYGGYAIHGSYETGALGRPASHGCIRLAPANAAKLFSLVQAEGGVVSISGEPPPSQPFADEVHSESHRAAHQARAASPAVDPGPQDFFSAIFR